MRENKNIASIQVIRGIAALLVLLYHASALVSYRFGYDLVPYLWWGYSGVDIFFVLSGFIIYYTAATNSKLLPWEFFLRRVIRIYPVFWIALIVVISLSFMGQFLHLNSGDSSTIDKVSQTNISSILGTMFLIPKSSEIILVAWTLSYEMMFYILFTLLFFKSKKLFFSVMSIWTILSITAAAFHTDFSGTKNPILAMLNPIMIEFLFGCIIAILYEKYIILEKFSYIGIYFIIGVFSANVIINHDLINVPTNNQYFRFLIYGAPAAAFIFYSIFLPISYPRLLIFLGDASYSIYLFHYPVMGTLAKLLNKFHIEHTNFIGFSMFVIVTLSICGMIYLLIEKPILEYGKKQIRKLKLRISKQELMPSVI